MLESDLKQTRIACIGAGNVGRAWAIVFARAGFQTSLYDQNPHAVATSKAIIAENVADLEDYGLVDSVDAVLENITSHSCLEEALENVVYVQESIVEKVDAKRAVFTELDTLTNEDVVIASSTSEIMPSCFFSAAKYQERCVIAHPVNPPYLIPLVEICPGENTSEHILMVTRSILERAGMSPVTLSGEIRGFLLNRLQAAVVGEALHLTGAGYCSPKDLEAVMTQGLGLRWSFLGPFMTSHLNASSGYKDYMRIFADPYRRMIDDLKPDYPWSDQLFETIEADLSRNIPASEVPEGQRWRDRRLMDLLNHLNSAEKFEKKAI